MNLVPPGYRVVWKHWRVVDSWWWNNRHARLYPGHPRLVHYGKPHHGFIPAPYGGYTECYIYNTDREIVATGHALCSLKDQFVYKIGRQISLGRALKQLQGK